ncbi:hypothetical protein ACTJJ7_20005 [Phyllobacterium sp. 22229]|uniref:hypothetical protein n=1 Tax=Phyllobacterium sp. 22229 TaxID=3453895 RepID=UPI003F839356
MSVQSFIFGPGQKYKTQEDLDRARAMVRDMYGNIGSPRTIGEGLSALGDGIMANVMNRRIAQGQGEFDKNRASADAGFLSGMSGLGAPAFPSSVAAGGSPTAPAATGVQAPDAEASALPSSLLGALDKTEGGGNYDTLYGNAQRNGGAFSGINVSQMPIKDVLAFSDPNGRYAQSVKSQIGRVATPMGRHQIVGTTLRNAVDQMGIDPNTPFDRNTQDAIATHLARSRISAAGTMEGKIAGLRSEWAGLKNVPDAQLAQIVNDLENGKSTSQPTQVASLDPSSGMEQAYAPTRPRQSAAVQAINQVAPQQNNYPEAGKVAPVDWTDQPQFSVAAGMQFANGQPPQGQQMAPLPPQQAQTPQAGQDGRLPGVSDAMLRANDQMMGGMFAPQGQQPVQIADNGGYFPPTPSMADAPAQQPQQNGNRLEFYARQMSNPFLSPEMKKLALYQYQQEAERQQQASDPMRQLQLQKGQLEIDALKRGKSALLNAGNGQLYNPNTGQWITAPDSGKDKETTDIQNYNFAKQNDGYSGTLADWVNNVKRGKNSATVNGNTIDLESLPPVSLNEQGAPDPASQAEFLSKLPTSLRAQVQGISEGRIPIEKVTSMRGGERQELARIVSLFDPTFDMSQSGARVAIRKDYASGEMAKLAASSNLALQHAGGMLDAAEKLDNGQYPWVNAAGNYFASKTGQGAQSAFETYRLGVADELGKAFHGVGAVPVETVKEWKNAISTSSSPEQLRSAVDAAVHMLAARTETYNQRYRNVMGQDAPSFLTPESVKTLTKLGIDPSTLDPRYVDKSAGKNTPAPLGAGTTSGGLKWSIEQ